MTTPLPWSDLEKAINRFPVIVSPELPLREAIVKLGQMSHRACRGPLPHPAQTNWDPSNLSETDPELASCLLVVEAGRLVGLLTQHDVVKLTASGEMLMGKTVASVMTRSPIALAKADFQDLFAPLALFHQHRIRHLPIVDQDGSILGLITPTSLRQALRPEHVLRLQRVEKVMIRQVIQASPETLVVNLARQMVDRQTSSVVVTEPLEAQNPQAGVRPLGIITERDLVQFQALELPLATTTARQVMSTPLFCLQPQDSLWLAQETMQRHCVQRLVVVDDRGALVGLLTQSNLLQALNSQELSQVVNLLHNPTIEVDPHRSTELEHSETNYRLLAEQATDFISRHQPDGTYLYASPACRTILGYEPTELVGQNAYALIHPDDFEALWQAYPVVNACARDYRATYRARHQQGHYVWVEAHSQRIFDPETRLLREVVTIMRDVSDRKQAEQALQTLNAELEQRVQDRTAALERAYQRLTSHLENSPLAVIEWDSDFHVQLWSKRAEEIFGYLAEEVLGKHFSEIGLVYAEDLPQVSQATQKMLNGASTSHRFRNRNVTRSGQVIYCEWYDSALFDASGNLVNIFSLVEDITQEEQSRLALKASQHRFAITFHASPVPLSLTTYPEGCHLEVNASWCQSTGYVPEEAIGRTAAELRLWARPEERNQLLQQLQQSGSVSNFILHSRRRDGQVRIMRLSVELLDLEGQTCILSAAADITEQVQAESALRQRLEMENRLSRLSAQLVSLTADRLEPGINQALGEIATAMGCDRGYVVLCQPDGTQHRVAYEWSTPAYTFAPMISQNLMGQDFSWWSQQLQQLQLSEICCPESLPPQANNERLAIRAAGVKSLVALPLQDGPKLMGYLAFEALQQRIYWSSDRTVLLQVIGELLGSLLRRHQTEQALQESEQRFRAIFNQSFELIGLLEPDGILLEVNQTTLEFSGCDRNAVVGRPFWEAPWWIDDADRQQLQGAIALAAQGELIRYEVQIRGSNDRRMIIDFSLKPARNDQNQIVLLIPEGRDISDRKQAENRLQLIYEVTEAIVAAESFDAALGITLSRVCAAIGWQFAEVWIPQPDSSSLTLSSAWYSQIPEYEAFRHESTAVTFARNESLPGRVWQSRRPEWVDDVSQQPTLFLRADSANAAGLRAALGVPVLAEDQVVAVFVFFSATAQPQDHSLVALVTSIASQVSTTIAYKRAELALRESKIFRDRLIANMQDGFSLVDLQGRHVEVNQAFCRMTGFSREELLAMALPHAYWPPECLAEIHTAFAKTMSGQAEDFELTFMRKSGERFTVIVSPAQVTDDTGKVTHFFALVKDISVRKETEDQVRLLNETLEQRVIDRTKALQKANAILAEEIQQREKLTEDLLRSNQELEQFAYIASHDLQEPLRTITSYTQLLDRRYSSNFDEKGHKYMNYVVDGANRMQQLITDLLAYSRVGRHDLERQTVNSATALAEVVQLLQTTITEAKAEITHDELPVIQFDPGQFRQLLQNLIGNAVKYHGEEPPKIHIAALRQENAWQFAIRDNGIGIDPQYAERIFVVFQRLHTRREYAGTGIGLAVCKKIVDRHGGKIWVESQPNQGSTFYFTVPD